MASSGSDDPSAGQSFGYPGFADETDETPGAHDAVAATAAAGGSTTEISSDEAADSTAAASLEGESVAGAAGQPPRGRRKKKRSGHERLNRAVAKHRSMEADWRSVGHDDTADVESAIASRIEYMQSPAFHRERLARRAAGWPTLEAAPDPPEQHHPVASTIAPVPFAGSPSMCPPPPRCSMPPPSNYLPPPPPPPPPSQTSPQPLRDSADSPQTSTFEPRPAKGTTPKSETMPGLYRFKGPPPPRFEGPPPRPSL